MKRIPLKIGLAVATAAACLGTTVAANAGTPAPAAPAAVAAPAVDAATLYRQIAAAPDREKAFAALPAEQARMLLEAYPLTAGKPKVTTKPLAAASKYPKGCWAVDWRQDVYMDKMHFAVVWMGAKWCSNGKQLGAAWRAVGGYSTFLATDYDGNDKRVNSANKRKEIYMVAIHKFVTHVGPVDVHKYFCQKLRLKHYGKYAWSNSCNPS